MKVYGMKREALPERISSFADEILEHCAKRRLGLKATLALFLPKAAAKLGAAAAAVWTLNEDLRHEVFSWQTEPGFELDKEPYSVSVRISKGLRWITQPLDLDGKKVGTLALGYKRAVKPDKNLPACLNALAEELDNTLWNIHSAAVKQKLTEKVTHSLTRSVLSEALDEAVKALHEEIRFKNLAVVYRNEDAGESERVQYRVYRGKNCVNDSQKRPHKLLGKAVAREGLNILIPERHIVRNLLGMKEGITFMLSGQSAGASRMGKIAVEVSGGLSTFGRDMMRIFANSVSQRLIDYNRERRHMAKFFAPKTVSELLSDPYYAKKYLSPRVKTLAILYSDINSFTKICEKHLRRPDKIAEFVDRWSAGVVDIGWKRGGVFDKMVGDCVILLFGPPFFRLSPAECAREAALAAKEIQAFTVRMGRMPKYRGIGVKIKTKGMGVATGINLCPAATGLFGPNQDFTAFSSGMNQTARLQSKAGFRETLIMASGREALLKAKLAKGLKFEGPYETEAKNVARPLKYYKVKYK
ncbi:MAG: adenylate/guanylate cyclase domain-containing protein [Elusimicrobia bacterium CG08_land_8_20_14_0_20_51_18]|nr:MAG: adenylate/guanylate cyclase domain-containing protein [Elusimicrobia bacterium CG08_land_8_20_14_0_20_51_18]